MPNDNQAARYSSVMHYLGAVKKVEVDDPLPVTAAAKAEPFHDVSSRQRQGARGGPA
jgi:hypothetical protein